MDVLAWILSGLLAAAFTFAGFGKVTTPYEKLRTNPQMRWTEDFRPGQVKAIGTLELLGALGLVLPWLLDTARVLSPIAALGLAALMIGAMLTHRRRGELAKVGPINGTLFVLAAAVAVLRFSML